MANENQAVFTIGGDASGAINAFAQVKNELRKLNTEARQTGNMFRSAFGGFGTSFIGGIKTSIGSLWTIMRGFAGWIGGAFSWAWNKLKWGIAGVGAALTASYSLWSKEASAQAKLNSLLRANVRDYERAGKAIDSIISKTMRTTNFDDDAVRGIFGAFMQTTGQRGFNLGTRFTAPILDLAAARGLDPEALAEAIGRAIATRQSTMLRRQGILVDDQLFKRDAASAVLAAVSRIAPGAASGERNANPLIGLKNNILEVFEGVGRSVAHAINPTLSTAAIAAQDLAEKIASMDPAEAWDSFKELAADSWAFFRAEVAAVFDWLSSRMTNWFRDPISTSRKAWAAMPDAPIYDATQDTAGRLGQRWRNLSSMAGVGPYNPSSAWKQANSEFQMRPGSAIWPEGHGLSARRQPFTGQRFSGGGTPSADPLAGSKSKYRAAWAGARRSGNVEWAAPVAAGQAAAASPAQPDSLIGQPDAESVMQTYQQIREAAHLRIRGHLPGEGPLPDAVNAVGAIWGNARRAVAGGYRTGGERGDLLAQAGRFGFGKAYFTQNMMRQQATQVAAARRFLLSMSGGWGSVGADALGIVRQLYGDQVADIAGAEFRGIPAQAGARGLLSPILAMGGNAAVDAAMKDRAMERALVQRSSDAIQASRRRGAIMPAF